MQEDGHNLDTLCIPAGGSHPRSLPTSCCPSLEAHVCVGPKTESLFGDRTLPGVWGVSDKHCFRSIDTLFLFCPVSRPFSLLIRFNSASKKEMVQAPGVSLGILIIRSPRHSAVSVPFRQFGEVAALGIEAFHVGCLSVVCFSLGGLCAHDGLFQSMHPCVREERDWYWIGAWPIRVKFWVAFAGWVACGESGRLASASSALDAESGCNAAFRCPKYCLATI